MRRGPASLRGAMGTYAAAAALLTGVLAVVFWIGGPTAARGAVALPAGSRWSAATLDDGHSQHELRRGEARDVPPGRYRLTLLDEGGGSALRELVVGSEAITIDD